MELNKIHSVYFLGIGGIGMSALALYFIQKGVRVSGYDRVETTLTRNLVSKGAHIVYEEEANLCPYNVDLLVYTPAVPATHLSWQYIQEHAIPVKKRAEVLGMIADHYKTIGVAGTHGKTTISTMITHILSNASIQCNAFLGGLSKNFDSNLLIAPQSDWMVVEADEFDRSFLQLHPWFSVVSAMDADHLDIYGDKQNLCKAFAEYVSQTNSHGLSFLKYGLPIQGSCTLTYHLQDVNADYYAENITIANEEYSFDLITPSGK
ncbi:MAG: Mur ligase domain-containing protein, partial [Bacteroidales bacterium]